MVQLRSASFSCPSSKSSICGPPAANCCSSPKPATSPSLPWDAPWHPRHERPYRQIPGIPRVNRSILIVICDFLLVSLLAFSTVDINKTTDSSTQRTVQLQTEINTNQPDSAKDLTAVMRSALDEERKR